MEKEIIAAIITGSAVILAAIVAGIFNVMKRGKKNEIPQPLEVSPDNLLETVTRIRDYVNGILIENEQTLSPLFSKEPSIEDVRNGVQGLFHIQKGRGRFGDWIAYLEHELTTEEEVEIKAEIEKLLVVLKQLHVSFYSYIDSPKKLKRKFYDKKHFMLSVLESDDVNISDVRAIANDYLEHLRNAVETIGAVNGKIRAIRE